MPGYHCSYERSDVVHCSLLLVLFVSDYLRIPSFEGNKTRPETEKCPSNGRYMAVSHEISLTMVKGLGLAEFSELRVEVWHTEEERANAEHTEEEIYKLDITLCSVYADIFDNYF